MVSVIVPNYNHAPYLQQRIESILTQTYQDFELILLDDCSTDNSHVILERYRHHPKVSHLVFNDENSGSTFRQWDKGIRLAVGDYIWIAESDDWAESEFLQFVINAFERNKNAGFVFVASKYVDSNGQEFDSNQTQNTGNEYVYQGTRYISERFLFANAVGNASAAVFRKEYYAQIKNKSYQQMTFCGDWFCYVQLCELADVVYIQKTVNKFRVHAGNVSTNAERNGKHISEGLLIYDYIKSRYLTVANRLKSSFIWGKNIYKYQKKYNLSDEMLSDTIRIMKKHSWLIYCNYCLYKFLKSIKAKECK
jgi:glycosyltransferase involved in cell wall biosynthesis